MGLQHGDEGKGRFIDELAATYNIVVRYNGGANAGHTIKHNGVTLALHQLPSGVNHPHVQLYIASHCVVNPAKLMQEIREVESHGLSVRNRLRISPFASVVQPSHIVVDSATMGGIGTTKNGIGVAYAAAKMRLEGDRRLDIRTADIRDDVHGAMAIARRNLEIELERYNAGGEFDVEQMMGDFERGSTEMQRFIDTDPLALTRAWRRGNRLLLEGAQAFGLDNTYGATPDITGSNVGVQAALLSTALPPESVGRRIGVVKAIPTRVGYGAFPSEFGGARAEEYAMENGGTLHTADWELERYGQQVEELLASDDEFELGIAIRMRGNEYGATTKRPRRPGALDLRHINYAVEANGINELFVTKVDCLRDFSRSKFEGIPVVNEYRRNGHHVDHMPTTKAGLLAVEPQVHVCDGFTEDLSGMLDQSELPPTALRFIHDVQRRTGARISKIGVGPGREQMINLSV